MTNILKWTLAAFVAASLSAPYCSATTTTYTTEASFEAATSLYYLYGFEPLAAADTANQITPPTVTRYHDVFSIDTTTDNGSLYAIGAGYGPHYGAATTLSSQASTSGPNNLLITLPVGETAVSVIFNSFVNIGGDFTRDPVTVTLSNGFTDTILPMDDGTYSFLGFTSTTPITSIELSEPDVEGHATLNLAGFEYGTAATPEPASVSLLGLGIFALAASAAYRRKLAELAQ